MIIKLKLDYVICADGIRRHVVIFPDGDFYHIGDKIHALLMHLEVLEMELGNEFTVDDNK